MHMGDALVSPAVGTVMWAATAATTVYCARRLRDEDEPAKVPLMGVLGAFIFAAQMINFTIPGTGSSGHLGGGLILAVLLGPHAAFLTIASVLTVQALFFADGGLLALGANIINLGVFPAFVAYPLFRWIAGSSFSSRRVVAGAVISAEVGLLLGAAGVVLETVFSGVSSLPLGTFMAVMLPIHAVIAVVEGLVTAGVLLFVKQAEPGLLPRIAEHAPLAGLRLNRVLVGLLAATVITGGVLSLAASANPDGLEWAIARVTGSEAIEGADTMTHDAAASLQEWTALLPDYGVPEPTRATEATGTSLSGIVGAAITLGCAGLIGLLLARRRRRAGASAQA